VAELGEVAFDGQRDAEHHQRGDEVQPSPAGRNVVSEHTHDGDDEVAHTDVARVDQSRGGRGLLNPPVEVALAQIRGSDMAHQPHEQPSQLTQPALGRRKEQREHDEVRPPVLAVDPQQALKQHSNGIGRQVMQVCRILLQEAM
jgi:hypothetical protein